MRPRPILCALAAALAAGCASVEKPSDPTEIAKAYAEAGRFPEAAREIELAVRAHPHDPELRRHAASIEASAGNLSLAVDHLEIAIRLAPRDAEMWISLGQIEMRRRNPADAYVAFRRAIDIAPRDLRAISGLAVSADSLGFDEEADLAYARWAELERERDPSARPPSRP
jgi:Flp pilus assembly protein TadD